MIFNPASKTWDSSITSTLADTAMLFRSFEYAFANNTVSSPILYARLYWNYKKDSLSNDSTLSLFRYHRTTGQWSLLLNAAPTVIAPAARGCLYTVTDANRVTLYRDSVSDAFVINPDSMGHNPVIPPDNFNNRIFVGRFPQPAQINDLLFLPQSDSSGHLFLASSDGLFISWNEVPGITTDSLTFVSRARAVQSGLKETYALPGILTDNTNRSQVTFIYKLSRDAKVTIMVYDYAMRLTRVVTSNAFRKAAGTSGRSTDTRNDVWDGRTDSGRLASPGVYYYKITASTGEHSFGKIVVAKGLSN